MNMSASSHSAPRRVALTGATGFLGLALARRLREEGLSVSGLVRARSAPAAIETLRRLGVTLVEGDVTVPDSLPALVRDSELVIHSAAIIGYRRRLLGRMAQVNVLGTQHVAAACLRFQVPRLLHISSIAAIGFSETPRLLDEDSPWNGDVLDAGYFDTKHEAEVRVQQAVAAGLDAVVVNPGAIYGPSSLPSNSNQLVAKIASGRLRTAPEGGVNVVPLETVVQGVLAAARRGRCGRRYVLGGENLTIGQLFARIAIVAGRRPKVRTLPTRLATPLRAAMNLVEPLVPDGLWYTPDLCATFGRYLWFDVRRMRDELEVAPGDLEACLAAVVQQLRSDGRLARS
ncbi:MAG: NAD-dependent epimerase/dehydratase family protein [Planctomycetota bacterium]